MEKAGGVISVIFGSRIIWTISFWLVNPAMTNMMVNYIYIRSIV